MRAFNKTNTENHPAIYFLSNLPEKKIKTKCTKENENKVKINETE